MNIFALGFGFATTFWLLILYINNRSWENYLLSKAQPKYRTALYIRNQFFYIMPESEYVEYVLQSLQNNSKCLLCQDNVDDEEFDYCRACGYTNKPQD